MSSASPSGGQFSTGLDTERPVAYAEASAPSMHRQPGVVRRCRVRPAFGEPEIGPTTSPRRCGREPLGGAQDQCDRRDASAGVTAFVANEESRVPGKQECAGCRPRGVIRLAHHPGDAAVLPGLARLLSAWPSARPGRSVRVISPIEDVSRCLLRSCKRPLRAVAVMSRPHRLPGDRFGGRWGRRTEQPQVCEARASMSPARKRGHGPTRPSGETFSVVSSSTRILVSA